MTLVWASGYNGITDPDAQTYIAAVEAADGQAIEGDVALAINDFVVGCKLDGIWDAIKASCILAGARTLSGALVPLKGTAPTNNNFVSGDYNRETGLVGNSSTKFLNSNRNSNADPQNNNHLAVFVSSAGTNAVYDVYIGVRGPSQIGTTQLGRSVPVGQFIAIRDEPGYTQILTPQPTGFIGGSRSDSGSISARLNSATVSVSSTSETVPNLNHYVLARNNNGTLDGQTNGRLSFYSIGESIDLEQLDTRTTRLMNLISYSLASGLPDLSTMDIDAALYIGAVYRAGGTLS